MLITTKILLERTFENTFRIIESEYSGYINQSSEVSAEHFMEVQRQRWYWRGFIAALHQAELINATEELNWRTRMEQKIVELEPV